MKTKTENNIRWFSSAHLEDRRDLTHSVFMTFTALLLLSFLSGCDILDLFDQTPTEPVDRIAVGTVMGLPEINLPDGSTGLTGLTSAGVYFGRRASGADMFLETPTPLTGASITLTIIDDKVDDIDLPHTGEGMYAATTADDDNLKYRGGATYRISIDDGGRIYEMDLERAPAQEKPDGIPDIHPAEEPMTITWSRAGRAAVEIHRIEAEGLVQTYSNRPSNALELLDFALKKESEETSLTIPAEAFSGEGLYFLVFISMRKGFPEKDLFVGSTLMVGAGTATPFEVRQ